MFVMPQVRPGTHAILVPRAGMLLSHKHSYVSLGGRSSSVSLNFQICEMGIILPSLETYSVGMKIKRWQYLPKEALSREVIHEKERGLDGGRGGHCFCSESHCLEP